MGESECMQLNETKRLNVFERRVVFNETISKATYCQLFENQLNKFDTHILNVYCCLVRSFHQYFKYDMGWSTLSSLDRKCARADYDR